MKRILAVVVLVASLTAVSAQQPAAPPTVAEPAFEVASVKRNVSGDTRSAYQMPPNGPVSITNATLRMLLEQAYPIAGPRMASWTVIVRAKNALISGSSDPREQLAAPRFDIQGKPPDGAEPGATRAMLRTLLADRFKLRVHWEKRETPAYMLTVAREGRLGEALRPSQVDCQIFESEQRAARSKGGAVKSPEGADGRPVCTSGFDASSITAGKMTVRSAGRFSILVGALQPYVSRPIVDNTGLTGLFEWTLSFGLISDDPAFDTREAGLLTAIRDQLGLRLEPSTAASDVLVIDSVEMPSEN